MIECKTSDNCEGELVRYLLILVLAIFLHACGPQGSEIPRASLSGADIWKSVDNGGLLHRISGVEFPEEVTTFERGKIIEYKSDGSDVSVGYFPINRKENSEITIYISRYPSLKMEDYLQSSINDIHQRWKQFKIIYQGEYKPEDKEEFFGPLVVFEGELLNKVLRTGLWMTQKGDWFVMARFTYVANGDNPADIINNMIMAEIKKVSAEVVKANNKKSKKFVVIVTNKDGLLFDMIPIFEVIKEIPIANIIH